jgi:hypothetical protein
MEQPTTGIPIVPEPQPTPDVIVSPPEQPSAGPPPSGESQAPPEIYVTPPMPGGGASQAPPGVVPMVKEKREFEYSYPANSGYSPLGHGVAHGNGKKARGVQATNKDVVTWLNHAANSKERESFSVAVMRRMPPVAPDGSRLKQGRKIFELGNLMPFQDVYNTVEVIHGGGEYTLSIVSRDHFSHANCTFTIDGPPIFTEEDQDAAGGYPSRFGPTPVPRGGNVQQRGYGGANYTGVTSEEDHEIIKAHKAERLSVARAGVFAADAKAVQAAEALYNVTHRKELQAEDREKDERAAALKEQQLKLEMVDKKEEREDKTNRDLLLAMISKQGQQTGPDFTPIMKSMEMMVQQNAASSKNQIDLLLGVLNAQKAAPKVEDPNAALMNNLMMKFMDISMTNSGAGNEKYDKIIDRLLEKKLEAGDEIGKMTQYLALFQKIQGPQADGDGWMNPEAGFWSNAGNAALSMMKNMIQGVASGGGGSGFLSMLNSALRKPEGNVDFTDEELAPIAHAVAEHQGAPQLAAPALQDEEDYRPGAPVRLPQQPAAQAAPAPNPMMAGSMFIDDPVDVNAVQPPMQPPMQQPAQQPQPQPAPQPVVQSTPVQLPKTIITAESAELPALVDEVVLIMISDLESGRERHEWPVEALASWDASFLRRIAKTAWNDDTAKLEIIREKTDPALFQRLQAVLLKDGAWTPYQYWVNALRLLAQEAKKRDTAAA